MEHAGEEARKRWRNRGRGKGRRGEQEGMGSRELKKEKWMCMGKGLQAGRRATGHGGGTGLQGSAGLVAGSEAGRRATGMNK